MCSKCASQKRWLDTSVTRRLNPAEHRAAASERISGHSFSACRKFAAAEDGQSGAELGYQQVTLAGRPGSRTH
jgi:hypothetical protein